LRIIQIQIATDIFPDKQRFDHWEAGRDGASKEREETRETVRTERKRAGEGERERRSAKPLYNF